MIRVLATCALLVLAQPALAQETPPDAPPPADPTAQGVFAGDFIVVGAGPVLIPSYEGSDALVVKPGAAIAGRIAGITISPRAAGLALDLIPAAKDEKLGLSLGPVVRYRTNRTSKTHDPVVDKLPKLKGVLEAGVNAGLSYRGALNPYDSVSASVDVRWDVSGRGGGRVVSPGVSYLTPLSQGIVAGAALSSDFVDDAYARYNFGIDAAGAAASGLPVYVAHGGFKDWNVGAGVGFDLDGNLLNGGPVLAAGAMYSRLYGAAAESPITALRGKRGQWFFGAGLAWVF